MICRRSGSPRRHGPSSQNIGPEHQNNWFFRASIRYRVMTGVPENWTPFVPARVPGAERQVRLQRAAMPRPGAPDPHARVRPLTALLRDGLEAPAHHFFLFEEEVPREGARVVARFQRTPAGSTAASWSGSAPASSPAAAKAPAGSPSTGSSLRSRIPEQAWDRRRQIGCR